MRSIKICFFMAGIVGIMLCSVAIAQPASMPHVIFGSVTDSEGNVMVNISVKVINERTDESLLVQANNNGQYQADLSAMPSGYQIGDTIRVEAESGELEGAGEISVSTGPNDQLNIVLEEKTGTPAPGLISLVVLISGFAIIMGIVSRKR